MFYMHYIMATSGLSVKAAFNPLGHLKTLIESSIIAQVRSRPKEESGKNRGTAGPADENHAEPKTLIFQGGGHQDLYYFSKSSYED